MRLGITGLPVLSGWTYDDTGTLFRPNGVACTSKVDANGYRVVRIGGRKGKMYKQHRVIFFLHNGYLPEQVDHKDRDRANNAPTNLRAADNSINQHNVSIGTRNKSGTIGVCYEKDKRKWKAQLTLRGTLHYQRFDTKAEAILFRQHLEKLHKEII